MDQWSQPTNQQHTPTDESCRVETRLDSTLLDALPFEWKRGSQGLKVLLDAQKQVDGSKVKG